jgi:uncharacterized membrane protein
MRRRKPEDGLQEQCALHVGLERVDMLHPAHPPTVRNPLGLSHLGLAFETDIIAVQHERVLGLVLFGLSVGTLLAFGRGETSGLAVTLK